MAVLGPEIRRTAGSFYYSNQIAVDPSNRLAQLGGWKNAGIDRAEQCVSHGFMNARFEKFLQLSVSLHQPCTFVNVLSLLLYSCTYIEAKEQVLNCVFLGAVPADASRLVVNLIKLKYYIVRHSGNPLSLVGFGAFVFESREQTERLKESCPSCTYQGTQCWYEYAFTSLGIYAVTVRVARYLNSL